jgi:branched-chain amino acid aminotransferase
MEILQMKIPDYFTENFIREEIELLNKNNDLKGNGRVRINVFRNDGGVYAPVESSISFTISAVPADSEDYQLNHTGLHLDFFTEIKKQVNIFSSVKTCNSLLFVMAGIWKNKMNFDDIILLNDNERVCEAISSNIFLLRNNEYYTPAVEEGCIAGVMRSHIINLLKANGLKVNETTITQEEILLADEIFLTNASSGIRWVGGCRKKRYFSQQSKDLINLLNNSIDEY